MQDNLLTSWHLVYFVLDEKIDQRNQGTKEQPGQIFPVFDSDRVGRAQGETAESPWQCSNKIANHEDIMPIVVIR